MAAHPKPLSSKPRVVAIREALRLVAWQRSGRFGVEGLGYQVAKENHCVFCTYTYVHMYIHTVSRSMHARCMCKAARASTVVVFLCMRSFAIRNNANVLAQVPSLCL